MKRVARFVEEDEEERGGEGGGRADDPPADWPHPTTDTPLRGAGSGSAAAPSSSSSAAATSPHRRLHQPARGCLKSASRSSSSAPPPPHHAHQRHQHADGDEGDVESGLHVHFLTGSGTSPMVPARSTSPPPARPAHVVIDLHQLVHASAMNMHSPSSSSSSSPTSATQLLTFRPVPFGMLRARHTYTTRFGVVGGHGRTLVDGVDDDIAAEMSVCKEPPLVSNSTQEDREEMFEIIFRPTTRGPFEGSIFLTVSTAASAPQATCVQSPDFMHTESQDREAVSATSGAEDAITTADGSDNKKRKRDTQPEPALQRYRLRVVVTAQILKKGMGKPSLRDGVRCIALDEEEDSDADSDWQHAV